MPMTLAQVSAFVTALPGVEVASRWGNRTYQANGHSIAWERPLTKADLARFGDEPAPEGEILALTVANLDAKDALLAIGPPGFFTMQHFDGYPAVLVALRRARVADVKRALRDAHDLAISAPPKRARPRARRGG